MNYIEFKSQYTLILLEMTGISLENSMILEQ